MLYSGSAGGELSTYKAHIHNIEESAPTSIILQTMTLGCAEFTHFSRSKIAQPYYDDDLDKEDFADGRS